MTRYTSAAALSNSCNSKEIVGSSMTSLTVCAPQASNEIARLHRQTSRGASS